MKKLFENWRKYQKEILHEDLQQDLAGDERDNMFFHTSDEDRPGTDKIKPLPKSGRESNKTWGKYVIVFSPDEVYAKRGKTHAGRSHVIKHMHEFDRPQAMAIYRDASKEIDMFENVYVLHTSTGKIVYQGEEAKQFAKEVPSAVLNTFDLINDKIKNPQEDGALTPEEELLISLPSFETLENKYYALVGSYMGNENSIWIPDDATSDGNLQEIKGYIKAGEKLSFTAYYRAGGHAPHPKGGKNTYVLDFSTSGIMARGIESEEINTLFRISKTHNRKGQGREEEDIDLFSEIHGYLTGATMEVHNKNIIKALEELISDPESGPEDPTYVKPEPTGKVPYPTELTAVKITKDGIYVFAPGYKEHVLIYIKQFFDQYCAAENWYESPCFDMVMDFPEHYHEKIFKQFAKWLIGFWAGKNLNLKIKWIEKLQLTEKQEKILIDWLYKQLLPENWKENRALYMRCIVLVAMGDEEAAIKLVLKEVVERIRKKIKEISRTVTFDMFELDICDVIDCEKLEDLLRENKQSTYKIKILLRS
jgi:hypothetical protein